MYDPVSPLSDQERAELRRTAEAALDDLTASLTQVFKAVNKVHRAVSRLGLIVDESARQSPRKDHPSSGE